MTARELQRWFGSLVRNKRKSRGLTQEELSIRARIHRTYLADIERGARNPSLGAIFKLATALGISLAELFSSNGSEP